MARGAHTEVAGVDVLNVGFQEDGGRTAVTKNKTAVAVP